MAENKTRTTNVDPHAYIDALEDTTKRADAKVLASMMQRLVGQPPKMWGGSIIGFGDYHYQYESGHQGDMFLAGFAPRKAQLVIYLNGIILTQSQLLEQLGKHKMGKGCLYIKRLEQVDMDVLEQLITASNAALRAKYIN